MFGERPIIPTFTRNPGVGRPPGSSTDGVFVPVSRSPVRSPSSSSFPQSWPAPPPRVTPAGSRGRSSGSDTDEARSLSRGSRARTTSRKGTILETNNPETNIPLGAIKETKTRGRPPSAKNKPKPNT